MDTGRCSGTSRATEATLRLCLTITAENRTLHVLTPKPSRPNPSMSAIAMLRQLTGIVVHNESVFRSVQSADP